MTVEDIAAAAKLGFVYHPDTFPELSTFGVHTGRRDTGDIADLLSAFLESMQDAVNPIFPSSHMYRVTYSEWTTVGFTGWHQVQTLEDDRNFGSTPFLPHQLAIVVGVTNTSEVTVPVARRRNRSYVGPLNAGTLSGDGRITTGVRDALGDAWSDVNDAISAVTAVGTIDGLACVSPAAGEMYEANLARVGLRYDVHRSRAQQTAEDATNFALA